MLARADFPEDRVDSLPTAGRPWVLEPAPAHLVQLLRLAAGDRCERERRGAAGVEAAQRFSWDAVAAAYSERLQSLAGRRALLAGHHQPEPLELSEDVTLRVLATPAWRADDRLGELLAEWVSATSRTTSACLYLLADPATDGNPSEIEARVLAAAAQSGADLDSGADINVLIEPARAGLDIRLHAAVDAYVPLHAACSGHARLAGEAGNTIVEPGTGSLTALLRDAGTPRHGMAA